MVKTKKGCPGRYSESVCLSKARASQITIQVRAESQTGARKNAQPFKVLLHEVFVGSAARTAWT
jgi:hypothetical protein